MTHVTTATSTSLHHSTHSDDAALLAGLLSDDANAWRQFSAQYSRLIHSCISRVISRFASVTSQDDINEVYSMLCLQLLAKDKHKLRSFDLSRGNKLGTWLGMLASHAAYDLLRSRRRCPLTEELDAAVPVCAQASSADDVCAARQQAARLNAVLASFSEKDQLFFELYFGEGLDAEQVAIAMQINVKTVYSKKHKLRARLESAMAQTETRQAA